MRLRRGRWGGAPGLPERGRGALKATAEIRDKDHIAYSVVLIGMRGWGELDEVFDANGERIWFGEASPELLAVADRIGEYIDAREDEFAGHSLTSDRTMVEVYVAGGNGENDLRSSRALVR